MNIRKIIFLCFLLVNKIISQSHEVTIKNDSLESLTTFFEYIVEHETDKQTEFFDALVRCYEQLKQNDRILYFDDFVIALPLMMAHIDEYKVHNNQRNVNTDTAPIITLLNAIKQQINQLNQDQLNCCEVLRVDFGATFSMLLELSQSFSLLDTTAILLLEAVETLTNSITSFTGFSSSIVVLQETMEECCEVMDTLLNQTWSSINEGFGETLSSLEVINQNVKGTFSVLEEINNNLINGNNAITEQFRQTWTILDSTLNVMNNCCNTIADDFNATWTLVNTNLNQVFDLLSTVTMENSCEAILLSTPTTITSSGSYCLSKNITGTIIINAHDVVLDLNDYTLFKGQIIINTKNNCVVKNGILDNNGIGLCAVSIINCSDIIIDNLIIINSNNGIQCGQATNVILKNSIIHGAQKNGIDIINTVTALRIQDLEIINTTSNAFYCNANMQDVEFQNVHIKFSNGIRAEAGLLATNIKFINVFVEGTHTSFSPIVFLGNSSNFYFDNVHVFDADQGMFFSFLSQGLFQNCSVRNISTLSGTGVSGFRIDGGNNNQFYNCNVLNISTIASIIIDAFKIMNSNTCHLKHCSVEGLSAVNGMVAGFNATGALRVTIEDCAVQNIVTSSLATGYYLQGVTNAVLNNCIMNGSSLFGYYFISGKNIQICNCSVNGALSDGFRSLNTTNIVYEYCYSNNNGGAGFNVTNAICGNCESSRNIGFGFNGNSTSTVYNCFSGFNTAGAYLAVAGPIQALGATGQRVGYNISA